MRASLKFAGRLNLIVGIVLGGLMARGNYDLPFLIAAILFAFTVVAFLFGKK